MFIYLFMLLLRGFYRLMKLFLDWISSNLRLISQPTPAEIPSHQ